MKKIVVSSNTSWSVFNFRLELISHLSKYFHVEVIAPKDQYSDQLRQLGFTVHNIEMASSSIAPFKDLMTLFSYVKLLKEIKPDYYLGFTAKPNIYGGFIAAWLSCKVVNNIAGLGRTFSQQGLLQRLMHFLYRVGLSKSHHVFFQNRDDLALFEQHCLLLNKTTRSVLPGSGVNIERFSCKANRNADVVTSACLPISRADATNFAVTVNQSIKSLVFLFSARLLLEKGIREFIAAARRLKTLYPYCTFEVLGKHNGTSAELPKNELDAACSEGVIKYLGTTDDVLTVLHGADCFVLPSFYREGVPRSLLEAGSCGLPLITTDSVGCRETVVDGVNGYLISPRDSDALFDAMNKMVLLSEQDRDLMGQNSRRYMIEHFSEEFVLQQYQQILMDK
ncbi:glycosyltransferase family 4 protein [Shewanella putrefaciens]|uniref:glycosyltransferase family 4 protein n=1 Tax=Shewanella putrefaciens TaxID=24 RepID=UPI00286291CA|nr:glycosyltransferase family 4 protein [Shewanella putrefaciens]MDR6963054.1 glycosyltransferase involved in cell wall biosynthesis [Shewanella putrefaciens]